MSPDPTLPDPRVPDSRVLRRRTLLKGSLAAALTVGAGRFLVGCGGDDAAEAGADLRPVRAMMPSAIGLPFVAQMLAVSAGLDVRHGIDLEVEFPRAQPQAFQQLAAGNVDVILGSPLSLVRAASEQGADFVAIGMPVQTLLYVFLSSLARPIGGLADVEGATVGVQSAGGNAEDVLDVLMQMNGYDPGTITYEATAYDSTGPELLESGRLDLVFANWATLVTWRAAGYEPHVFELPDPNPILGNAMITTRAKLESDREALLGYVRAQYDAMTLVLDEGPSVETIEAMRGDFDLPALDDPAVAQQALVPIARLWVAAGRENLLRCVPDRWDTGIAELVDIGIAAPGSAATDFYTNELVDQIDR